MLDVDLSCEWVDVKRNDADMGWLSLKGKVTS